MALIAITSVISVAVTLLGQDAAAAAVAGFIPGRASIALGGSASPGALPVALTPLTSAFVHGGILHLASNMVMLGFTGVVTERVIGARGFLLLYLVGAFAAAAGQWLAGPNSPLPMVGASGATSAVIGAYALLFGRPKTRDLGPIPAWPLHVAWLLAAWVVVNVVFGLVAASAGFQVAVWAHVGGFVAGLALCRPLLLWKWRNA